MKKSLSILFAPLAIFGLLVCCTPPEENTPQEQNQEENPNPEDLLDLSLTVSVEGDGIYSGAPTYVMHVTNPNDITVKARIQSRISTDFKEDLDKPDFYETIPANSTKDITIEPTAEKWDPGFYKINSFVNGTIRVGAAEDICCP